MNCLINYSEYVSTIFIILYHQPISTISPNQLLTAGYQELIFRLKSVTNLDTFEGSVVQVLASPQRLFQSSDVEVAVFFSTALKLSGSIYNFKAPQTTAIVESSLDLCLQPRESLDSVLIFSIETFQMSGHDDHQSVLQGLALSV